MDSAKQLYIPDRLNVGFQERQGTYTGKLAYVIYFDNKGVLRKAASWESWRNQTIQPVEFKNEPTEGFVLNKGVGGQRASYGWNARNEYIRVYDPRDFEFEISVANLLFILRECNCSKGKGLEGKFVYAWDGNQLVLLPVKSEDYKNSKTYTQLQGEAVAAKDMIPGATYTTKKQQDLVYLGKLDYFFMVDTTSKKDKSGVSKRFVFWDGKEFLYLKELKTIAVLKSDVVSPDFADLMQNYANSSHGSKVTKLFLKEFKTKVDVGNYYGSYFYYEESPGVFAQCRVAYNYHSKQVDYVQRQASLTISDKGVFTSTTNYGVAYPDGRKTQHYWYQKPEKNDFAYVAPTDQKLFALMESGAEIMVESGDFTRGR